MATTRQDLERLTQWTLDALDLVVAFGHVQSGRRSEGAPEQAVVEAAGTHLRRLLPFHTVAFFTVDEDDGDFVLTYCDPDTEREPMQHEVDDHVADGMFALARRHNRAVTMRARRPGHALVLHPLVAGARTVGMFAGVLRGDAIDVGEAGLNLLSLVLFQTAQALHGARLEATIRAQNAELAQAVDTRTRELSRAEDALRQAQKMEAVGQLTGGVAHDFNNLLTVVLGSLERLRIHTADAHPELDRLAARAAAAAHRGAELTHRLLAFGRRQPLAPRPIDVGRLAVGMTALLRRTLGETVELAVHASDTHLLALADPGQVENALLNLALNARDAMPNGGSLVITVSRAQLAPDPEAADERPAGDFIAVSLSDTGVGMTAEVRARAFEPFFTTKETGKGSGLGLSMVYGFAKQSGGDVVIESAPGQGSTVTLYLPCSRDLPAAALDAPPPSSDVMPGGSETVLVVEDDAHVREFVVAVLRELGYRVLEAATAHEALAILDGGATPDVLYTDVVLPGGMSGHELAAIARERRPSLRTLYTSGYTASALMPDDAAVLLKPYRREDLARAIRDTMEPQPVCS